MPSIENEAVPLETAGAAGWAAFGYNVFRPGPVKFAVITLGDWACNCQTTSEIETMLQILKTLLVCSAFLYFAGYSSSLLSQTSVGEYEEKIPPAIMPPMRMPPKIMPLKRFRFPPIKLPDNLTVAVASGEAYRKGGNRILDLKLAHALAYDQRAKVTSHRVWPKKFNSMAVDAAALSKTLRQLVQICDADFDEVPIGDVVKLYAKKYDLKFQVDAVGSLPVTLKANGTRLREILKDLLASANCEYFVLPNGEIYVRKTPVRAESTKD